MWSIMEWIAIGFIVGTVLGLTGSGGGLMAIPLLMVWVGFGIKQATVLSLLIVILGSVLNWYPQRSRSIYSLGIGSFVFSLLGSALAATWKEQMPEQWISITLIVVALFSLVKVWRGKNDDQDGFAFSWKKNIFKIFVAGFLLGVLTTITGLGGGVLLVPLYLGLMHLSYNRAVATSLFAITLASAGSLIFQYDALVEAVDIVQILMLILGTIGSVVFTKWLMKRLSDIHLLMVRKLLFTCIVVWVLVTVL